MAAPEFENQIRMNWKVFEESVRENIGKNDGLESDISCALNVPGVEYYLCLDLNDENPNEVYIYLHLDFKMPKKISAICTVFVKSATHEVYFEDFVYEESHSWGTLLCTRDDLFDPEKKFFLNGIMEIELVGSLKSYGIKRKAAKSLSVGELLWKRNDKDIELVVGEEKIMVHEWILCANSPVFKTEMESGMKESQEKKIVITNFDFEIVKLALEFFYERGFERRITDLNAMDLLRFADKYDIKLLHEWVQSFFIEQVSVLNVVEMANMSVALNAPELREYCICILLKHVGKNTSIKGADKLNEKILQEIGRRSLFYYGT